jgi:hypothetical protein
LNQYGDVFDRRAGALRLDGDGWDIEELRHFSFGDLELSRDDRFVESIDARPAATHQLGGPERRQYHELKRPDTWRTLNQSEPPSRQDSDVRRDR